MTLEDESMGRNFIVVVYGQSAVRWAGDDRRNEEDGRYDVRMTVVSPQARHYTRDHYQHQTMMIYLRPTKHYEYTVWYCGGMCRND